MLDKFEKVQKEKNQSFHSQNQYIITLLEIIKGFEKYYLI